MALAFRYAPLTFSSCRRHRKTTLLITMPTTEMPQAPKIQSGGPKDLRFFVVKLASDGGRNLTGRRTESDRAANGIRSGGGRNPIRRRTESDRTADGIRSDGGRCTTKNNGNNIGFAEQQ